MREQGALLLGDTETLAPAGSHSSPRRPEWAEKNNAQIWENVTLQTFIDMKNIKRKWCAVQFRYYHAMDIKHLVLLIAIIRILRQMNYSEILLEQACDDVVSTSTIHISHMEYLLSH